MLEGKYTVDTVFPENDHRRHRPRSWLVNGVEKVKTLDFLTKEFAAQTDGYEFNRYNAYDPKKLLYWICTSDVYSLSHVASKEKVKGKSQLTWDRAKHATRDAWDRIEDKAAGRHTTTH